jgi:hypothetical protein
MFAAMGLAAALVMVQDADRWSEATVTPLFADGRLQGCSLGFKSAQFDNLYFGGRAVAADGNLTVAHFGGTRFGAMLKVGIFDQGAMLAPDTSNLVTGYATNATEVMVNQAAENVGYRLTVFNLGEQTSDALLSIYTRSEITVGIQLNGEEDAILFRTDLTSAQASEWLECYRALLVVITDDLEQTLGHTDPSPVSSELETLPPAQDPIPASRLLGNASALPPGFILEEPTNEAVGPWTKYQVPPLPPGFTLDPPTSPAEPWLNDPIVGSAEDPYAGIAQEVPPPPPGFRPVSELSDAELLQALLGPGWEGVRPDGWTLISRSSEVLTFFRPARQPRHIWLRVEYSDDASDARSVRSLNEVDCAGGRLRIVSLSTFRLSNLEGPHEGLNEIQSWDYVAPGTHGEALLQTACGE